MLFVLLSIIEALPGGTYTKPKKETPHIKHTFYMGFFYHSLANDLSQVES